MSPSTPNNDLMNTLKGVDISNIEYIKFSINMGENFIVKTDNVKRLAKYISESKNKTTFSSGELNEVYNFVTQYLTTDIPKDVVKIISERLKLFCENGGSITFGYKEGGKGNIWNNIAKFDISLWINQCLPIDALWIEKKISLLRTIWLVLFFFWIFPAFGSMFMFDAPGSQNSNITNLLAGSIITYPIFVITSWILSRILFHFKYYRSAFIVSCIPMIDIAWFVIMLYLSITVCGGQFACAH